MKTLPIYLVTFILSLTCATMFSQDTIRVPEHHQTIQAALNNATSRSIILIAPGTYYENIIWRTSTEGVKLISKSGKEETIIDGGGTDRVFTIEGLIPISEASDTSRQKNLIQGFTIRNGYVSSDEIESSAGINVNTLPVHLKDVVVRDNFIEARRITGVGISILSCNAILENVHLINNRGVATEEIKGIGLSASNPYSSSKLQLFNCTIDSCIGEAADIYGGAFFKFGFHFGTVVKNSHFSNNTITASNDAYGGGIHNDLALISLDSCSFVNNFIVANDISCGGGFCTHSDIGAISNCQFYSNKAENGAALYYIQTSDDSTIKNCTFANNDPLSENGIVISLDRAFNPNLFFENNVVHHNKGIFLHADGISTLYLYHCTFAFNEKGMTSNSSTITARNTIFWKNGVNKIATIDPSKFDFSNCMIGERPFGEGNLLGDPLFISEDNLIPSRKSPCLNSAEPDLVAKDIRGFSRLNLPNKFPDIGAYEVEEFTPDLKIKFFNDTNQNGTRDNNETFSSLGSVKIDADLIYNNIREAGLILYPETNITVTYNNYGNKNIICTTDTSYTIDINQFNFDNVLEFGISEVELSSTILVPSEIGTIQAALDIAKAGTTILVNKGLYYENLVWPNEIDSIQLIGVHGASETIIDGCGVGRVLQIPPPNGLNVGPKLTNATVINGFTIKNGYMRNGYGVGLYVENANPTLTNLRISENIGDRATLGAGVYLYKFNGIFRNNIISKNKIINVEFLSDNTRGAGMHLSANKDIQINDCVFESNHIESAGYGGAISMIDVPGFRPTITLNNCSFINNSVDCEDCKGGALSFDSFNSLLNIDSCQFINNSNFQGLGGAIFFDGEELNIENSTINKNTANSGSAIYTIEGKTININNCEIHENNKIDTSGSTILSIIRNTEINLENNVIHHNSGKSIATIPSSSSSRGQLNLNHVTLAYNEGPLDVLSTDFSALNSIFWNNSTYEIIDTGIPTQSIFDVSHCIVKGGFIGENIISADPDLINDFFLFPSNASPAIAKGLETELTIDIFGTTRPLPAGTLPDIGAYESDMGTYLGFKFYIDENLNGIKDSAELYVPFGSVSVNNLKYINFRSNGVFIPVEHGSFDLRYLEDETNWMITNNVPSIIEIDNINLSQVIDIGITPVNDISQISTVVESGSFRCQEEVQFQLKVINSGTLIESGIVWIDLDVRINEVVFTTPPDYEDSEFRVGWDIDRLSPHNSWNTQFIVTAPSVNNPSDLGENYNFNCEILGANSYANHNYKAELRCSYDPNDKQINPRRDDMLVLDSATQVYTIRFQNTGNDYARNVVITDTLDTNLDLASFEIISTSHERNLVVSFNDESAVKFEFSNIFLPDSTSNEPKSHGHITYQIKPKENVELNSIITNTAFIYFDLNPPIITNTTEAIVVEKFPLTSTLQTINRPVDFYPNPTNMKINFTQQVGEVRLYALDGRLVLEDKATDYILVNNLEDGAYIVKYTFKGKTYFNKVFILK